MRVLLVLLVVCGCKGGSNQTEKAPPDPPPANPVAAGCKADEDCVVSCAVKGDCCSNPFCESVQPKAAHEEATKANAAACKKEDVGKCPQVGDRQTPDYKVVPRCRAGACTAEKIANAPAADGGVSGLADTMSPSVDFTGYDLSCKAAADCTHVKSRPCDPCDCSRVPIATRELPRYQEAAKAITCKPVGYACGKCTEGRGPECVAGKCQ